MPSKTELLFSQILNTFDKQLDALLKENIKLTLADIRAKISTSADLAQNEQLSSASIAIKEQSKPLIDNYKNQVRNTLIGKLDIHEDNDLSQSLSLVDDSALNESIQLHELTNGLFESLQSELRALKRGIVRLSHSFQYEPEPQGFEPRTLFDVLQKLLVEKNIDIEFRKLFFDNFNMLCKKNLQTIYAKILFILEEGEVLSEFENPTSKSFDLGRSYKGQKGTQPGSAVVAEAISPELELLDATIHKELKEQHSNSASDTSQATPIGELQGSALATNTDKVISKLLYQYIASSKPESGEETLSGTQEVTDDKLIHYLSSFQKNIEEMDQTDPFVKQENLHSQVSQVIEGKGLQTSQLNIINLIQKLFDVIAEDVNFDVIVTNEISRLQIPYLKVALLDINILNDASHSARQVLNAIADIGLQVDDEQDPNFLWIKNIINFILTSFDNDVQIFDKVLVKLHSEKTKLESEANERAQKYRSKAEKEARTRFLKKRVLDQLHKFIANKQLPKQMYELVLKGFAPLFLRIYVRHGEDSPEWKNAIDLFRKIIESVQPRDSIAEINKIVQHAPELISEAKKLLGEFLKRDAEKDLLNGLKHLYKQRAEELRRRKTELASAQKLDKDPLDYKNFDGEITLEHEESANDSISALVKALPEKLKEGVMCEVYLGKQLGTRRMKVLSIIKESAQIIFVDGTGSETRIKDMKDFLDELDCERSHIIEQDNLFDKALATVLMNMEMAKS